LSREGRSHRTACSFRPRVSSARWASGVGQRRSQHRFQSSHRAGLHQGDGLGTNRGSWPTFARFVSRLAIGRIGTGIHLVRRPAAERHMWPLFVVPIDRQADFAAEGALVQGHQRQTTQQHLERKDQSLDDRQAPVLADRPISWRSDPFTPAPMLEGVAVKLRPMVADDVAGCLAGCGDGLAEHPAHFSRGWFLEEHGVTHNPAGEMILGQGQPPGKRPTSR